MPHDELFESKVGVGMTKSGKSVAQVEGVYCHGPSTVMKAEHYCIFEEVFSDGARWAAKFDHLVDRDRGCMLLRSLLFFANG